MAVKRDKILREAEKLVQKGRIEQAIKEYEKLLKANPNDPNTINRIGDLYGRIGKVDRAVELYEQIADHFTRDGFTTKAIAILKKINRIAPDRLDIFEKLADLYLQQGLVVEAKNQLQMLADWYTRNGDLENSIRVLERIVQVDPNNHMIQLRLADLHLQQGEAEKAVEVYDRLGTMLLGHGRLEEAEKLYRHVLEAGPPSGEVFLPICKALITAGKTGIAQEFLDAAIERSPENPEIQALQIELAVASGEGQKAVAAAEAALQAAPDSPEVRWAAGKAFLVTGEGRRAKELLLPVVDRSLASGAMDEARSLVNELLQYHRSDREVLERAVQAYEGVGEGETVLTLKAALADVCFRGGDREEAEKLYLELTRLAPDRPIFRERLAQLRGGDESVQAGPEPIPGPIKVPRLEDETSAGVPVPEAEKAGFDPQERFAEANVFAKYGLIEKAIDHLREILASFPEMHEAREKLVTLLVERGDVEGAREIAAPLEAHYRREGMLKELKTLRGVLGESGGPEPVEVLEEEEEEVLFIELDAEDEAVLGVDLEEPAAAEAPEVPPEAPPEEPVLEFEIEEEAPPAAAVQEPAAEPVLDPPAAPEAEPLVETVPEPEPEPEISKVLFEEPEPTAAPGADDQGTAKQAESPLGALEGLEEVLRAKAPAAPPPRRREPAAPAVEDLLGSIGLDLGASKRVASAPAPPVEAVPEAAAPAPPSAAEVEIPASPSQPVQPEEEFVEISDEVSGPALADLQQVDFFISQELYDDALRMLDRLEESYPDHPEILERRAILKARGVLFEEVAPVTEEAADELFAEEEEYIDLAAELEAELEAEEAMVEQATGHGQEGALLEEVFREFQKGVSEQLSEEDSDTHFNLGIAYKEMGLLPEAISEFQISAKNSDYEVESLSMIGLCYVEQGLFAEAASWYRRALESPRISDEARLGVLYDLGNVLEQAGELGEAAEAFASIVVEAPGYRDAAGRLQHLEEMRQAN